MGRTKAFITILEPNDTDDGYIVKEVKEHVTCVDCRFAVLGGPGLVYCDRGHIEGSYVDDDFYCAYGVKREEKTDE